MELELLIEEQKSIKSVIDEKVALLNKWFKDKIEEVRNIFRTIKSKAIESLSKNVKDSEKLKKKVGKDIEIEKNGKKFKFISKNDTVSSALSKAKSEIKSQMNEVKKLGDKAISKCQRAMRLLIGIKDEDLKQVKEEKISVIQIIRDIAAIIGIINFVCKVYKMLI